MNKVLVIGSGGREHALCWRLRQSPLVARVFCAPGNAGIAGDAECVAWTAHEDILRFCREESITLVVVGPEQPLVEGLADRLRREGITVFGPGARAAQLEGSKGFMKGLCRKYGIPTAAYGFFEAMAEAKAFLEDQSFPVVIKADGLAAGKGVVIAQTRKEAEAALEDMFSGKIAGGGRVVIEEFLEGQEVSFFALCDGKTAVEFGYAQDHKRAYDGDQGPNTGGMGTYSPPSVMTQALRARVMRDIILPTARAMKQEGAPFNGVLFAGLMLTASGPKLLEYNVRFGDPETQSLMMRFDGDLFLALLACAQGRAESAAFSFRKEAAVCVVMAAKGYPGGYDKGSVIRGLKQAEALAGVKIFHAGTARREGDIIAAGGRVLGVCAVGTDVADARRAAYAAVDVIDWPEGFFRRDIAART